MASGILRILLALIVVVHHMSRLGVGKACVFIFFMLSGFWVARMWNEKYRHCEKPWRSFVTARFLRIWPLFVLVNLIAITLLASIDHPVVLPCGGANSALECGHALLANTLMLGYTTTQAQAIPPAWSLDIELQFYLLAPLIVFALRGPRALWIAAASLPLALAACFWLPDTVPQFLPFFIVGILAATNKIRSSRRMALLSGAATFLLLSVSFATATGRTVILTGANPGALGAYNDAFNALIAVLAAPFALYFAGQERQNRGAALGDIAFTIYIVHWIPVALVSIYWGHLPSLQRLPYVAGGVLATVAFALVLWRFVDRPMERWRRGLAAPRRAAPVAATTSGWRLPSELR